VPSPLIDHLNTFSVDDLRLLVSRRRLTFSPAAWGSRQALVRIAAAAIQRADSVYHVLAELDTPELSVLRHVLGLRPPARLSALAALGKVESRPIKEVLDRLRLWGLLFPEGDWEQIYIPAQTSRALNYLRDVKPLAAALQQPFFERAPGAAVAGRPESWDRDLAEFLARVARSRPRLTQAGRMHRRDLKAIAEALSITDPRYAHFVYLVAACGGLLPAMDNGTIEVSGSADGWLARAPAERCRAALETWMACQAHPENVEGDPGESAWVPAGISGLRAITVRLVGCMEPDPPVTVASVGALLHYLGPLRFRRWETSVDPTLVAGRILHSLYWLGAVALDRPERPGAAGITPLGAAALCPAGARPPEQPGAGAQKAPEVPEEPRFVLQPNAEVFAPPNLSPRTLFHLRRLTGEKKGGAAGMYPLDPESLRRALDSGLSAAAIIRFLESFSRTGIPPNVRSLVEDTAKRHGRIRLVPVGVALVTDDARLLEELEGSRAFAPFLDARVSDTVVGVDAGRVPELLRTLRARGYAPKDEREPIHAAGLPAGPDAAPLPFRTLAEQFVVAASAGSAAGDGWADGTDGAASDPQEVFHLLRDAAGACLEVEVEYRADSGPSVRKVHPCYVSDDHVAGRMPDRGGAFDVLYLRRISRARFTGESFRE